jgi:ABC-type siderophore export system fused ATPase/permease subunit
MFATVAIAGIVIVAVVLLPLFIVVFVVVVIDVVVVVNRVVCQIRSKILENVFDTKSKNKKVGYSTHHRHYSYMHAFITQILLCLNNVTADTVRWPVQTRRIRIDLQISLAEDWQEREQKVHID